MNQYGLTKEEKKTHLQEYNHALFQNSLSFMDIVWEINMVFRTIVVLENKNEPERNGREFSYDELFLDYEKNRIPEEDREVFYSYLSFESLKMMQEEVSFNIHFGTPNRKPELYRVVLTPAPDDNEELHCVYLGALNLHEEEQREMAEYRGQEMFREALMANSYFSFHFDVTAGGLIWGDFEARDGSHPIKDATGMTDPVPYDVWVNKWYELYEPEFDEQEEKNIFNIDYFKRAFEKKERLLDVEVKQKSQIYPGVMEYVHIFVVLVENPENKHILAYIIWRGITPFRRGIMEDKLNLEKKNEELKRTLSAEEQFRMAAVSDALLIYNINLTQNLIEDEFYEHVDGRRFPVLRLVGLPVPCSFDVFCKKWCEIKVPEDSRETFLRLYNRQYLLDAYERGEHRLEIEFDTAIGRDIPITLRNTVLLFKDENSGDIIAMVIGKDVTKQREEEFKEREALRAAYAAANRANRAKSDFLSRMSHDIRTPMNAIIGLTAIASTHLDDKERIMDCLSKITVSGKHLLGLINEVLDMSKIESGKIELQEEEFNLSDLIDNLLNICRPEIKMKKHDFSVLLGKIEHERVIGDSQRIEQAFMNLLGNAVKYTPEGGKIGLKISEKPTNKPRIGCYEFIFEDNGIGMSAEFQRRLFEPFERAEDERVQKQQGTGLGMTITKNIIQMMNGTIQVESELHKGSRFTVTFFLKLQDEEEIDYEQFIDLPVLVADDDEIACETTCEVLCQLGMRGEWVLSGQEAVERVVMRHKAENDYYAVILDWKMPEMDGVETTKEIRKHVGEDVPIIILSGYDWTDIEEEAREAGASAFISKPLFKTRLAYLFKELMGEKRERNKESSLQELEREDFSGHRALLAEDNELNAEIAMEIFGMTGLKVELAQNGKEAFEKMQQAEDDYYDIIFMDIQMPVMNGYESVRAIRGLDREYAKKVPIIAMSANAFAEDVQEARAAGMNEHVAKPLDFECLKKVLGKYLHL